MSKSASFSISFDIPTEVITAYFDGKAKVEASKNKSSSNNWMPLIMMFLPSLIDVMKSMFPFKTSSSLSDDVKICPFKMGSPKDESSEDDDDCSDSSSDEEEEDMKCEGGVCFVKDDEDEEKVVPTAGSVLQNILNLGTDELDELNAVQTEAFIQFLFNGAKGNEMLEQVSKMIPMFENIFSASKKTAEESDEEDFKDDEDSEVDVE